MYLGIIFLILKISRLGFTFFCVFYPSPPYKKCFNFTKKILIFSCLITCKEKFFGTFFVYMKKMHVKFLYFFSFFDCFIHLYMIFPLYFDVFEQKTQKTTDITLGRRIKISIKSINGEIFIMRFLFYYAIFVLLCDFCFIMRFSFYYAIFLLLCDFRFIMRFSFYYAIFVLLCDFSVIILAYHYPIFEIISKLRRYHNEELFFMNF